MNKFVSLLKYSFINSFNLNGLKGAEKKGKRKMTGIGMIAIGIIMAIYLFVMYNYMAGMLKDYKLPMEFLLFMTFISGVMATLYSSLYRAPGSIFKVKDYDLLASLPINKKSIIGVKLADILVTSYAFMGIIMIPALIVYYSNINFTITSLIINVISLIALPLIPISIGVFIAYLIYLLSSKLKFKDIALTVINVLLIAAFMALIYSIEKWGPYLMKNIEGVSRVIEYVYLPFKYYSNAIINGSIIDILIYLAISVVVFVIFIFAIQNSFSKINSRFNISVKGKEIKISDGRKKSQLKALYKSEFIRYISKSAVVINTAIGGIIYIIFILIYGFKLTDVNNGSEYLMSIIIGTGILLFSIAPTTATTISLEGQAFYMLKSLPIKVMDILKAKILLNITINLPFMIIGSVIAYAMKLGTFTQIITGMFTMIFALVFISIVGIIVNMKKYKFKWTSETVVVKRSASVVITMLIAFFVNLPMILLVTQAPNIGLAVYIVLCVIVALALKKNGEKMWNKIS